MNREELQDYEQEEKERAKAVLNKCTSLGFLDPRFFFEDKVHLKENYAVRMDMEIPVKLLLPFYEQILVPIRPLKSPEEFEKRCGITIEELEIAYTDNRVIPLPVGHLFLYDGIDYLMPILERKPPTMLGTEYVELFLAGNRAIEYAMEANAELAGRFKDLAKQYKKLSYFQDLPRAIEEQLEIESIDRYKTLSCFGYNRLAKSIARIEDIASVYYQLGLCNAFLASPFLTGGIPQYSIEGLNLFRSQEFLVKGKTVRLFEKAFEEKEPVFPTEIARILVTREEKRLRILFPSQITLSDVLTIAGDSAFQKARKALHEFYFAVENKLSVDDVLSRKAAIDKAWDETREAIKSMEFTARVFRWMNWSFSLGLIGTLAVSFAGFPGLLSLLGAAVTLDKIIPPERTRASIVERLGSLPVAIYKLEQVIKKTARKIE